MYSITSYLQAFAKSYIIFPAGLIATIQSQGIENGWID